MQFVLGLISFYVKYEEKSTNLEYNVKISLKQNNRPSADEGKNFQCLSSISSI